MVRRIAWATAVVAVAMAVLASAPPAESAEKKLVLAVAGIPPIFASTIAMVADKEGFFKRHDADVEVKYFESGTAAARAVISGDLDAATAPTPVVVSQISNAGVDLVALWGMPSPDFLIASVDPAKPTCADLKGEPVGVDAIGGARSVALKTMLAACGGAIEDVRQIVLPSSSTTAAMIAGRIAFGVLHIDELPVLAEQGKPATVVYTIGQAAPDGHFAMIVAKRGEVAERRDDYVRMLAGIIDAARWVAEPKNADRFAEIAAPTGRTPAEAKGALEKYLAIGFWPADNDGLERAKLEAVIQSQVKTGGIKSGKTPVSFEQLVDASLWKDAAALAAKP